MDSSIDQEIVNAMLEEGIDFVCSVPCVMLAGILKQLADSPVLHVPVTREEEGVGVTAGAFLGGKRPALLMQHS